MLCKLGNKFLLAQITFCEQNFLYSLQVNYRPAADEDFIQAIVVVTRVRAVEVVSLEA